MSYALFGLGLASAFLMGHSSLARAGQDKAGVVAFPFTMLLAAAIAKYIGL